MRSAWRRSQVRAAEAGTDEVGAAACLLLALLATDQLAGLEQQLVDRSSFGDHVDCGEVRRTTHVLDAGGRRTEICMDRLGRLVFKGFREIPEQFVQLPQDGKRLEHLLPRLLTPALAGPAGDLLARAEAVVDRAALEALLPQLAVNPAPQV